MQRGFVWLAVAALAATPRTGGAVPLDSDPSSGTIVVLATKTGLLSSLAHDHRLVAGQWRTEIRYDVEGSGTVEVLVVVDAGSLHESTPRLGETARAIVDREVAGADVLDAKKYPEIRIRGTGVLDPRPRGEEVREGVLRAELTLHGTTRPLVVPFRVQASGGGFRAIGNVTVRQTEFGMTPYSTAMGTIGVDDELRIEFDLLLRPTALPQRRAEAIVSRPGG